MCYSVCSVGGAKCVQSDVVRCGVLHGIVDCAVCYSGCSVCIIL